MSGFRPDRRELLTLFLGSAVAASACRRTSSRPRLETRIVDAAVDVGHRLREAARPAPGTPREQVGVCVVGAGVAGLSAVWRLAGAGVHDVAVLELDAREGGTSQSGQSPNGAHPWGAHYLPAPLEHRGPVVRLLEELGAVTGADGAGRPRFSEQMVLRAPDERLFYRGHWYEGLFLHAGASAGDEAQFARFLADIRTLARARDARGRRAFAVPVEESSDDAEWTGWDRQSMADWMDARGYTSPRLRWWVEYGCRDDFGCTLETTSAWVALWYFASRQDGEGERHQGYLTWPEGNGRLVAQLARALRPGQLRRKVLVHSVREVEGGCEIDAWDAAASRPIGLFARHVIYAGPRFTAPHVLEAWRKARPSFIDAFTQAPWVVANLSVRWPPAGRGFPLAWDNVLYDSKSLGYVVAGHQLERQWDGGPQVLTWYYPFTGADPKAERTRMLSATAEDWETLVMEDLLRPHPELPQLAQRLEVMRWGHAMVRPVPGFVWGPSRAQAVRPLGRVHFAHADLGGINVFEEAQYHGVRAAEAILREQGSQAVSWL
ncbi:MAG TPA: NAD(P)-binding protein [Myxococcaceae bacterium]|nr:NAD(P)-binding protein [Myxococcaceae bacterium]